MNFWEEAEQQEGMGRTVRALIRLRQANTTPVIGEEEPFNAASADASELRDWLSGPHAAAIVEAAHDRIALFEDFDKKYNQVKADLVAAQELIKEQDDRIHWFEKQLDKVKVEKDVFEDRVNSAVSLHTEEIRRELETAELREKDLRRQVREAETRAQHWQRVLSGLWEKMHELRWAVDDTVRFARADAQERRWHDENFPELKDNLDYWDEENDGHDPLWTENPPFNPTNRYRNVTDDPNAFAMEYMSDPRNGSGNE